MPRGLGFVPSRGHVPKGVDSSDWGSPGSWHIDKLSVAPSKLLADPKITNYTLHNSAMPPRVDSNAQVSHFVDLRISFSVFLKFFMNIFISLFLKASTSVIVDSVYLEI